MLKKCLSVNSKARNRGIIESDFCYSPSKQIYMRRIPILDLYYKLFTNKKKIIKNRNSFIYNIY